MVEFTSSRDENYNVSLQEMFQMQHSFLNISFVNQLSSFNLDILCSCQQVVQQFNGNMVMVKTVLNICTSTQLPTNKLIFTTCIDFTNVSLLIRNFELPFISYPPFGRSPSSRLGLTCLKLGLLFKNSRSTYIHSIFFMRNTL